MKKEKLKRVWSNEALALSNVKESDSWMVVKTLFGMQAFYSGAYFTTMNGHISKSEQESSSDRLRRPNQILNCGCNGHTQADNNDSRTYMAGLSDAARAFVHLKPESSAFLRIWLEFKTENSHRKIYES